MKSMARTGRTAMSTRTSFNMVAALKKGPDADDPQRSFAFDDCYVETKSLGMSAGGTAETTYVFTATRVREE